MFKLISHSLTALVISILGIGVILIWQIEQQRLAKKLVDHTDSVISQTHKLDNEIVDIESGMRGYIITNDKTFLSEFQIVRPSVVSTVDQLQTLVSDNILQKKKVSDIQKTLVSWLTYVDWVIATKNSGGDPVPKIKSKYGMKLVNHMRSGIKAMLAQEYRLRDRRLSGVIKATRITFSIGLISFLILGPLIFWNMNIRQRKEMELSRSEERFRLLVESTIDYAIFMLNPSGIIKSWNTGAERLKGYKAEEIIGKHFSIFYPPEALQRDHPNEELQIAMKEGKYEEENWRVRKDGSQFWASVVITAIYDSGKLIGFAKITRDLTNRKRAQEEAQKARDELETRVIDRTTELQKAVRLREDILAVVSHDLRSPLTAIQLTTALISRLSAKNEHIKPIIPHLQRIDRASWTMEQLISDLLDVSKIEAGGLILDLSHERAEDILHAVIDVIEPKANEKGITLETVIPHGCCPIPCEHKRIMQVFSNLLGNAIKFTPREGHIVVGAKESERETTFWVKDNGPGIRDEEKEKIFSRYWQSIETAGKGVGLGLAICKGIVEAHGGRIWVESAPGQGATFFFTLPR